MTISWLLAGIDITDDNLEDLLTYDDLLVLAGIYITNVNDNLGDLLTISWLLAGIDITDDNLYDLLTYDDLLVACRNRITDDNLEDLLIYEDLLVACRNRHHI